MSIDTFIEEEQIAMIAELVDSRPDGLTEDMPAGSRNWRCTLRKGPRRFTLYFSRGPAFRNDPIAADVLRCLASDAVSVENSQGFEAWAEELGYGEDSRKAEKIYRTCHKHAGRLRHLLGREAYERLLWNTDRSEYDRLPSLGLGLSEHPEQAKRGSLVSSVWALLDH